LINYLLYEIIMEAIADEELDILGEQIDNLYWYYGEYGMSRGEWIERLKELGIDIKSAPYPGGES